MRRRNHLPPVTTQPSSSTSKQSPIPPKFVHSVQPGSADDNGRSLYAAEAEGTATIVTADAESPTSTCTLGTGDDASVTGYASTATS